jgi:hypothetical protein
MIRDRPARWITIFAQRAAGRRIHERVSDGIFFGDRALVSGDGAQCAGHRDFWLLNRGRDNRLPGHRVAESTSASLLSGADRSGHLACDQRRSTRSFQEQWRVTTRHGRAKSAIECTTIVIRATDSTWVGSNNRRSFGCRTSVTRIPTKPAISAQPLNRRCFVIIEFVLPSSLYLLCRSSHALHSVFRFC